MAAARVPSPPAKQRGKCIGVCPPCTRSLPTDTPHGRFGS